VPYGCIIGVLCATLNPTTTQCKLDGAGYTPCTSPESSANLSNGEHIFTVEATDSLGNVSAPASYSWSVDTTAPPAPTITSGPSQTTAPTPNAVFTFTG